LINNEDIYNQESDLFSSFSLPKLYLSLMSEEEFYQQNNANNRNINQQNFSISGSLIIEPTRTSLKKIIQRSHLNEIEQNYKSVINSDLNKTENNYNILNNIIEDSDINKKSIFPFNSYSKKETDLNTETIGKCLFKQLFISDSDKRKFFTIFVKVI